MVQQIMTLLTHNNLMQDPIGVLIQAECKALRLETGWTGNIFVITTMQTSDNQNPGSKRSGRNVKNKIAIQSNVSDIELLRMGDCKIMQTGWIQDPGITDNQQMQDG